MFIYKGICLPEECLVNTKSLAQVKLSPLDGLRIVSQILGLAIEAERQSLAIPVQLEAYKINESALRISLAEEAIRLEDGLRDNAKYRLTPFERRIWLMVLGGQGLRLIRNPKLLEPNYDVCPDELVIVETLLMLYQGVFPILEVAQERIVRILSFFN